MSNVSEGLFIHEPAGRTLMLYIRVRKVFATEKSPYQTIILADLEGFGRSLIIDNYIQSTEADEHIYHELLVHPAMLLHSNPRRVLIIGGGEGATLREVLKHNTVQEAVMVDIDPVVVEFSKKYLEYMHQGSFYDKRAKVLIMDGFEYLRKLEEGVFDVVIMDLTDPYAGETAKPLYSEESFRLVKRALGEGGVMVTQAGSSYFYPDEYRYVLENVKKSFKHVGEYWTWIPSFGLNVNFILASDSHDPLGLSESEFDKRLSERGVKTRFINGSRFVGLLKQGPLYPLRSFS